MFLSALQIIQSFLANDAFDEVKESEENSAEEQNGSAKDEEGRRKEELDRFKVKL